MNYVLEELVEITILNMDVSAMTLGTDGGRDGSGLRVVEACSL